MRTTYTNSVFPGRGPRRKRRPTWRVALALFVAALACAALVLWRGPVGGALWQALAPVAALRSALGAGAVARLQDELARARFALADRDLLAQENAQLKGLLGRAPAQSARVLAGVLAAPPGVPYDTLRVDAGARHGLAVGDVVYAGGSAAVGEVSEVADATAVVTLYSAPGRELPAAVLHAGRATPLALSGQGAGSFYAEVPAGSAIAVGDPIVFAGAMGAMPAAVVALAHGEGESFVRVYASLPANIFELRFVEVATRR